MPKGKLIVLEGLDGTGKSTQLELAESFLNEQSVECRAVSFPNYSEVSGQLIKKYLDGEIICSGRNGAYAASAMYAVDRYISFNSSWRAFYERGGVVLAGRYTTSNAIYQLTKLPPDQHEYFLKWLYDFEYGKLGLPEPDCVIYLDMPVNVSQKLLEARYQGDEDMKDIHERDVGFLTECRKSALYAADKLGWVTVDCTDGQFALSIEEIYTKICDCLRVVAEC